MILKFEILSPYKKSMAALVGKLPGIESAKAGAKDQKLIEFLHGEFWS